MNSEKEKGQVLVPFALCLVPFILLATANSAGYRYGASDLAFYGPAVMRQLDPQLFPRDAPLIDAQARLTLMDETVAAIARLTTDHFPALFLGLYVLTLCLLVLALVLIGNQLYRSRWATATLLAAFTLRHAIPKSGTNTLEAYFHPRQLAFAFGALAVAAFLRGRTVAAACALAGAGLLHPPTTLWFALWLGVAMFVSSRRWRVPLMAIGLVAAVVAAWTFSAGPLAGRPVIMDNEWLDAIADKDYLFPMRWPASAWMVNVGYVPLIWFLYRRRAQAGVLLDREPALVIGCLSLVVVFLTAAVLNMLRVALAIQLQPARIFWMLDFLTVVYAVWALADGAPGSTLRPRLVAAALLLVSTIRGAYVMRVEFPDRPLFETAVPGDWGRVAGWAQAQALETGWLADPNHAAKYGTSLRMAAGRDVFIEATKDMAIGMYDRAIALRTRDRLRVVGPFAELSAERARRLAAEHDLDYLATEEEVPLPELFRSGALRVYQLR